MATKKLSTTKDTKSAKSASGGKLSKEVQGLVNDISKLSVMELSELVNALQDKLGVSAVPVAAAAAPAEEKAGDADAAAGKATQSVIITGAGGNKIALIKAIREINQNIGLKEAKDMTENLPTELLKEVKAEEAKEAAEKLKAAGAQVELK